MHALKVDVQKNRLYITLGFIEDKDEMNLIIHKTKHSVDQLKTGFTCITDLREYALADELNDEFIRECQLIVWDTAIGKVVRVNDPYKPPACFKFEARSVLWPAYQIEVASSIEQAETILDAPETLLYADEAFLYTDEVFLCADEVLLYSDKVLLDNDEVLLYANEVLLHINEVLLDNDEVLLDNDEVLLEASV